MMSRDLRWPEVTRKRRHLTMSHLEMAVEGWKLMYASHFTSYKAVACSRRQSHGRKWRHTTLVDRKWRHLTGSHLEVAVEGRKLFYTGYFTSYKAVARKRRQSHGKKWRHVSSSDQNLPGSDVIWPEVIWN